MTTTYNDKRKAALRRKILALRKELPEFVVRFDQDAEDKIAPATRYTYLLDIRDYLLHVKKTVKGFSAVPVQSLPSYAVTDRSEEEIDAWLASLETEYNKKKQFVSLTYRNRKRASLAALCRYLVQNSYAARSPLSSPREKRKEAVPVLLSDENVRTLMDGVLSNDLYLVSYRTPDGKRMSYVDEISDHARLLREKQISRNAAILSLLLYHGLRLQEIAAMDVEDVDFTNRCLRLKSSGAERTIPYAPEVREALSRYLKGPRVPDDLLLRQQDPSPKEFLQFCRDYMDDPEILSRASRRFGRTDDLFRSDILSCSRILRSAGRDALHPADGERALFLSSRGKRISARMLEHLVRDLTMTYLPELSDGKGLSPSALRSSRAAAVAREGRDDERLADEFGYTLEWAAQLARKQGAPAKKVGRKAKG